MTNTETTSIDQKPLLRMEGIYKSFPGVQALSDARFDLRYGEVHALVGENGAGKSTLMKILGGIYSKDAGLITLEGQEVEITSPAMAQHLGISIIHQELNLMPHLTLMPSLDRSTWRSWGSARPSQPPRAARPMTRPTC